MKKFPKNNTINSFNLDAIATMGVVITACVVAEPVVQTLIFQILRHSQTLRLSRT